MGRGDEGKPPAVAVQESTSSPSGVGSTRRVWYGLQTFGYTNSGMTMSPTCLALSPGVTSHDAQTSKHTLLLRLFYNIFRFI